MSFFEELPEPSPEERQRFIPPVWQRIPHEVIPVSLTPRTQLVFRSGQAALVLQAVEVYPTGIAFTVLIVGHPEDRESEAPMHEGFHGGPGGFAGLAQRVRLGVLHPDGSRATYPMGHAPRPEGGGPPKASLVPGGGGGSSDYASTTFWSWPLPAEGDLTLYFRWLAEGLEDTIVVLPGDDLRAAAAACEEIWPGAKLPEPPPGRDHGW